MDNKTCYSVQTDGHCCTLYGAEMGSLKSWTFYWAYGQWNCSIITKTLEIVEDQDIKGWTCI